MKQRITQGLVNQQKPGNQDRIIWDADLTGFGLKVTPRGRKVFFCYYRTHSGQQRRPVIGNVVELSADEARKIARVWLGKAAGGGDVSGERKRSRLAETIKDLTARYLTDYAETHKKASSVASDRSMIENHIDPVLGTLKVEAVTSADIEKLKREVSNGTTARREDNKRKAKPRGRRVLRGGTGVSNRVLSLCSKLFACAISWGLRTDNPARGIQHFKENPRDRFLTSAEVKHLRDALDAADMVKDSNPFPVAAIRLLLFTGLRLGEILDLRWRAVDAPNGRIVLEDSKTGKRTVPISTEAIVVLKKLPHGGSNDLVIQSNRKDKRLSLPRPWYAIRTAAGLGPDVTLHTLRHSFASFAVMGGLSLAETGALLGHRATQTTLRYAHHDQASLKRNANRVSSAINAAKEEAEVEKDGAA